MNGKHPLEWNHAIWLTRNRPLQCPVCTTPAAPVTMTPRLVPCRFAGENESEVIAGAQIRWVCPTTGCGYGEVVPCESPPAGPL